MAVWVKFSLILILGKFINCRLKVNLEQLPDLTANRKKNLANPYPMTPFEHCQADGIFFRI
jgi:hypothetical protein